jgi:acyl-CoA thioesterase FadM
MKLPDRIFVETWPESMNRETRVHFEQTGYGIDMATGKTSTIHVYERVKPRRKRKGKAR